MMAFSKDVSLPFEPPSSSSLSPSSVFFRSRLSCLSWWQSSDISNCMASIACCVAVREVDGTILVLPCGSSASDMFHGWQGRDGILNPTSKSQSIAKQDGSLSLSLMVMYSSVCDVQSWCGWQQDCSLKEEENLTLTLLVMNHTRLCHASHPSCFCDTFSTHIG